MNLGWISLARKIFDNPILKPKKQYTRFEAWIYLLMKANHQDNEVLIENTLFPVLEGQTITSQKKLALRFKWGTTRLRSFLSLLEKAGMIILEPHTNMTRISICNYSTYQSSQNDSKTKKKRKKKSSEPQVKTNNNVNNSNNLNNDDNRNKFIDELYNVEMGEKYGKQMLDEFFIFYSEPTQDGKQMKFQTFKTWSTAGRLATWSKKDFNGYFKIHKDEQFRKNQNKPEPVDESEIDEVGFIKHMASLSKTIGRS